MPAAPASPIEPNPDLAARMREAASAFVARFGRPPTLAVQAPGRVNLIGEHTDYNEGFVLPLAIERRTLLLAAPASDPARSRVRAHDLDREVELDWRRREGASLSPRPRGSDEFFVNYPLGVVAELHREGRETPNLDLLLTSDVPRGAGLSSSASIEVATSTLFDALAGTTAAPVETARRCRRAEHAFPGTPCGIMDMYVAAAAVPGHALFLDCRSEEARPIPFPPPERARLIVFDTGVAHDLAAGEYARRRATCEAVARAIGVPALRDATLGMLGVASIDGPSETDCRRATHVILENVRVTLAAAALLAGDLEELGRRMFESHASLRDLYEVSGPELDLVVDAAATFAGAGVFGARMTGGGFGGCAIALVEPRRAEAIAAEIAARFRREFGRSPRVHETIAAGGAGVVDLDSTS